MARSFLKGNIKDVRDFEARLEATLKPVRPPEEFVRDLREKLLAQIRQAESGSKRSTKQIFLIVAAGFLSVILIIVAGLRTLASFIIGLKLIKRVRKTKS